MAAYFINPWGKGNAYYPEYVINSTELLSNNITQFSSKEGDNPINKNIRCNCSLYSKANSFNDLVKLIKDAELRLTENGIKEIGDQINCLRGIYYGTINSLDYIQEKSASRNKGFSAYTTFSDKFNAEEKLKCGIKCNATLFKALQNSVEIIDNSLRVFDVGHLLIGLDARRSWFARNFNWPLGGTGLENVTLIGDLGGGAGMLALLRVDDPNKRAKKIVFDSLHDYACSVNIEGDIASYNVGLDFDNIDEISNPEKQIQLADGSEKSNKSYNGIYSAIESYISKFNWSNRAERYLRMLEFEFDTNMNLINRESVLEDMVDSVEGFAQAYIIMRSLDKHYDKEKLFTSFAYINSCAKEVCDIWLDGMIDLILNSNSKKFKAVTDPIATAVDLSNINEVKTEAKSIYDKVNKWLQELE